MCRASENHDVFSSRITWKRKSKGEGQGGTEETRETCVPQASPRYNVWRIKVRLTGCLSSNYAPLQLVPACCRRRPRRGQIVHVAIVMICAPIVIAIFKYTNFNKIHSNKMESFKQYVSYRKEKNSLAFADFGPRSMYFEFWMHYETYVMYTNWEIKNKKWVAHQTFLRSHYACTHLNIYFIFLFTKFYDYLSRYCAFLAEIFNAYFLPTLPNINRKYSSNRQ